MKNPLLVVVLVLLLCFAFGCQNKAEKAELEKSRAQAKLEGQNGALVVSVFDELNKKNADVYQELFAPEYGWHFPSSNPKGLSRDEESGFVKLLWAGFPDIHWDIEELVAHGDRVIARFVCRSTHTGEYQGILPTGNKFESGGIWMGLVKDGKILEAKEEADLLGMMQQLGLELKPKEAKK
jgi:ketosteroid isomerase-like protein